MYINYREYIRDRMDGAEILMASIPTVPVSLQQSLQRRGLSVADVVTQQRNLKTPYHTNNASALERLQQYSDDINRASNGVIQYLQSLVPAVSGLVVPPLLATLTAGITTTVSAALPTTAGLRLVVFVQAAGPTGFLAWDTMFRLAGTQINPTANTYSVFDFVAFNDWVDGVLRWFCTNPSPLTGQT